MEKDRRAGEGEGHEGRFRFRPMMESQKGQSQRWKGIRLRCAGMSVNLSEKQKANGRFWLGLPEGQDKCPA